MLRCISVFLFFITLLSSTEIYTLSLHDALPILLPIFEERGFQVQVAANVSEALATIKAQRFDVLLSDINIDRESDGFTVVQDRKSTRLNSSHTVISYAVFCLKKKTTKQHDTQLA